MSLVLNVLSAIARTVLKLVLVAAAAVFTLSLLLLALVSVVWVLLKALLTGRQPAWVSAFLRFRQASQQFRRGVWSAGRPTAGGGFAPPADVVDVQAHEVRTVQALPERVQSGKPSR